MIRLPRLHSSHRLRLFAVFALLLAAAGSVVAAVPAIAIKRLHNKGYILHWGDLPDDVDQVRLEVRSLKPKNSPFLVADTVPANRTGYLVYNLSPGQAVEWRASLLRDGQAETGTAFKVTTTKTLPPGYPQHWRAVSVRPDRVEIAWEDDTVTKETSYKIFRRDEFLETATVEIDLPKNSESYVDTTVLPGKNYFYTIVAIGKNKAMGDLTYELWVQTPAADALPNRPELTAQAVVEGNAMRVSWTPDPSGFVDGYSIHRKFNYYWLEVARVGLDTSSLLDSSSPAWGGLGNPGYRAVPFNVNGLAGPQSPELGSPQATPYPVGHSAWQEPVRVGSQFYLLDPGGKRIQRFDAASSTWLAPIEMKIPYGAYRFTVAASGEIFVGSGNYLYRVDPATGNSTFLASGLGIGSLVEHEGWIYYCGPSGILGIQPGAAGAPVIANATAHSVQHFYNSRVIRHVGNEVLISGTPSSPNETWVRSIRLSPQAITNPYTVQVNGESDRAFAIGGQKFLLNGDGELSATGDAKGPLIATLGIDKIRDTASLSNGGYAVLGLDSLHVYDRWWKLEQAIPGEGGKSAVREAGGKLWSIMADPLAPTGWTLTSFALAPAADDAGFWSSSIPPDGLEEGDDGSVVLVHRASGTWRSHTAGAAAFGSAKGSERSMVDWEYDPQRNALFLLSSGGLVSRHDVSSSTPVWDRQLPTAASFLAYSGDRLEISHSYGLTVDGDSSNNLVNWQPYPLQSPRRPVFTTWDPVSRRLYHQPYADEMLIADRALGMNIGEPRGLKNEKFSGFLRISPDRSRAIFGGGFIATYPDFFPLLQLPIHASDAAWNGQVLLAGGTGSGGLHVLASFDAKGKVQKAFTLPGEVVHVAKDGDGWLVLHRIAGGSGWRLIRGDGSLSNFTLVGGSAGAMPQATTLSNGVPQFPEWYESQVAVGDPDGNGFDAIQQYMMALWEPYLGRPPVQIVNYGGKDIFYITRRTDSWLAPFRLAIEYSGDLVNWTEQIPPALFDIQHGYPYPGASTEVESFHITPKDGTRRAYFRVRFIGPTFED